MSTITLRSKLALLAGMILLPAGMTVALAAPAASASAHPQATSPAHGPGNGHPPATRNGDNGTVKIHKSTTPVTEPRNQPHVCRFYLDGFGFDAAQSVSWYIKSWPPTGDRTRVSNGALTLDSNGNGHTSDMTLPDGHYKLFWNFTGEHGFAKQKVFWVKCPGQTPPPRKPGPRPSGSGTPSPSPSASETTSASAVTSTGSASPATSSAPGSAASPPSHSGLPITGWPLALIAGTGVVLLGSGGAAIALARRRRGLNGIR